MAAARRFELDDLLIRPGTYFNPQTEVLVVVDDSPEVDSEIFDESEQHDTEWVLISDESPIDEGRRDELLERFQATYHPVAERALDAAGGTDLDEEEEDEDDLDDDRLIEGPEDD